MNVPPEDTTSRGSAPADQGRDHFQECGSATRRPHPMRWTMCHSRSSGTILASWGAAARARRPSPACCRGCISNYEGMIKIDGMDLREIDLMHLRTNIGVVPQENFLFSRHDPRQHRHGQSRCELCGGRPRGSARRRRGIHRAVAARLRNRYLRRARTNLSGGQRQRLAIARALLIDPPVLILDEATSALDAESEAIVNANLKRMAKGRTVISISHRLSMLVEADAILVLERGKVYDIGTHEELLRRCDIYKHMWHQQNRHIDPQSGPRAAMTARWAVDEAIARPKPDLHGFAAEMQRVRRRGRRV